MDNRVTIVGCGPGAADLLTLRAKTAIETAECVVGSKRLIDGLTRDDQETIIIDGNYRDAVSKARRTRDDGRRVAFLVSGDPLFCSLGTLVLSEFGSENCDIVPGIGSIPYAFTLLKEGWKDYRLLSLHGNTKVDIKKALTSNGSFAVLLDPERNLRWIKKELAGVNLNDRVFYIGTNLSLEGEEFKEIELKDFDDTKEESLAILIVKKRDDHDHDR